MWFFVQEWLGEGSLAKDCGPGAVFEPWPSERSIAKSGERDYGEFIWVNCWLRGNGH